MAADITRYRARVPAPRVAIVKALAAMPDETVINGEVVALGSSGRPSFNELQNFGAGAATIVFYAFDVVVFNGRDVTVESLWAC